MSTRKIINSRQLGNESIFLSGTTGGDINQQGRHQECENQTAATRASTFCSSKYKMLFAFVGGAIVESTRSNDNQSLSLSWEEVECISGLNADNSINAND